MKAQIQQTLGAREWRWTLKEEAVNQGLNVGVPIPLRKARRAFLEFCSYTITEQYFMREDHSISFCKDSGNERTDVFLLSYSV